MYIFFKRTYLKINLFPSEKFFNTVSKVFETETKERHFERLSRAAFDQNGKDFHGFNIGLMFVKCVTFICK